MIELHDVSKSFVVSGAERLVLKNISYQFRAGTFYALKGQSGSGKSTLCSLILGFDTPSSGTVLVDDRDLATLHPREKEAWWRDRVGCLLQVPGLVPELTVLENCIVRCLAAGEPSDVARERALELLERVGCASYAPLVPGRLSGGEQQRVALVRALMRNPQWLIADEPTAHLDEENGKMILNLMGMFQKEYGMGLVISSHDAVVGIRADVLVELRDGALYDVLRSAA